FQAIGLKARRGQTGFSEKVAELFKRHGSHMGRISQAFLGVESIRLFASRAHISNHNSSSGLAHALHFFQRVQRLLNMMESEARAGDGEMAVGKRKCSYVTLMPAQVF